MTTIGKAAYTINGYKVTEFSLAQAVDKWARARGVLGYMTEEEYYSRFLPRATDRAQTMARAFRTQYPPDAFCRQVLKDYDFELLLQETVTPSLTRIYAGKTEDTGQWVLCIDRGFSQPNLKPTSKAWSVEGDRVHVDILHTIWYELERAKTNPNSKLCLDLGDEFWGSFGDMYHCE